MEPDPETWMVIPYKKFEDNLYQVIKLFNEGLALELDPESEIYFDENVSNRPTEIPEPQVIWIQYTTDENFFQKAANFSNVIFRFYDYDDTSSLKFYLQGIKGFHPKWKIGIVGGMFEDDVIRIANFTSEMGFSTTVLARQCISRDAFVNLDELFEYKAWLDSYREDDNDSSDDSEKSSEN